MIRSFQEGKDIYSFIASIAFNKPYEDCLEFTPDGEYNPEGKARRTESKSVVLGILYGRSTVTIADQLYAKEDWSQDKKIKQAEFVYESVLEAFPALRKLMENSEAFVKKYGYTETILGRRRHIPDLQLPEYEFKPLSGYINPDIDPLDINTLNGDNWIITWNSALNDGNGSAQGMSYKSSGTTYVMGNTTYKFRGSLSKY